MIRLIASDLDGTLLHNGAQQLTPRTIELIHALTLKGVHFIAASGRQYDNERRLFAPIKDEISYIAENGSLCIHRGEVIEISYIAENGSLCIHRGEVISRGIIPDDLAYRIMHDIRKNPDYEIVVSREDTCLNRRLQGGHLPDRGPLSGICKPYRKCHEKHDRDRR